MTKHMQVCEIGASHGGGAIFPPTVNFAENGTFWLSVKHKRLLFIKRPCTLRTCHIHEKKTKNNKAYVYLFNGQSINICQVR